jgi:c-di-GMP-binding flagellar brake protein YcgR
MIDPNQAYIEKRQFERVAARIQVRYQIIAGEEADRLAASSAYHDISLPNVKDKSVKDVMTVVTENVSVGGLMIVGDKPFKGGASMNVELVLPQTPMPLKALAVVVRASDKPAQTPQGPRYTAGLRFLAINKEDVQRIQRYIDAQKKAGNGV